jgi:hypothetical protein
MLKITLSFNIFKLEKCLGDEAFQKPISTKSKFEQMTIEELDGPEKSEPEKRPKKPLVRRGTFTLLYDSPDALKKEIATKDERIAHLEKLLDGQQGDSRAKLALEVRINCMLENI